MCLCGLPSVVALCACVGEYPASGGWAIQEVLAALPLILFAKPHCVCFCRCLWLCNASLGYILLPPDIRVFFRGCGGQTFFAANTHTSALTPIHTHTHTHTGWGREPRQRQRNDNDTVSGRPRPIRGEIIFRIFSTKLHINVVVQTNFYFRIFQLRFHLFLSIKFACTQKKKTKNKKQLNQQLKLEQNHKEIHIQKTVDRSCVQTSKSKAKKQKGNSFRPKRIEPHLPASKKRFSSVFSPYLQKSRLNSQPAGTLDDSQFVICFNLFALPQHNIISPF